VREVEANLKGKTLAPETIKRASLLATESAIAQGDNHYKIELAPRVIARAIMKVGGIA